MTQPKQIEMTCGGYRMVVADAGWDADPAGYPLVYQLQDEQYRASSWHKVTVFDQIDEVKTCLLTAGGGASGIHSHSAVCVGNRCYVAVGDSICAISVPGLDLIWRSTVDSGTCFGVHHVREHGCLISHGELEIARVDYTGKVVWRTSGRDIFTEGFVIRGRFVEATDWDKTTYHIDIETGQIVAELPPAQGA